MQQAPAPFTPTDPRLQRIVELVQSGLSESLIAESILREKVPYSPTPQDLLYLKQNRVPESIIAALLAVDSPTSSEPVAQVSEPVKPAAQEPAEITVGGLVMRTGALRRNRPGTVVFVDDTIVWRDARDTSRNVEIFPAGITKVELQCRMVAGETFCYQLEIDIARGDSFNFEDAQKDAGGNRQVLALRDAIHKAYPHISITERTRR